MPGRFGGRERERRKDGFALRDVSDNLPTSVALNHVAAAAL